MFIPLRCSADLANIMADDRHAGSIKTLTNSFVTTGTQLQS